MPHLANTASGDKIDVAILLWPAWLVNPTSD
jgi:hypothetical protein